MPDEDITVATITTSCSGLAYWGGPPWLCPAMDLVPHTHQCVPGDLDTEVITVSVDWKAVLRATWNGAVTPPPHN